MNSENNRTNSSTERKGSNSQIRRNTNRNRRPASRREVPEVNYVPPKPINRTQIILRLISLVAIVAAITFGVSIFFKVKDITVTGTSKYSAWEVSEASKIKTGDNLLFFGKGKAAGNILAELPYVKSVQIGIKLPDTVQIAIEEQSAVYAVKSQSGDWWLISADGKIMESTTASEASQLTIISGIVLSEPAVGQIAHAAEPETATTATEESNETTTPVTYTASAQLSCALEILQEIEKNGLVSGFSSLDVTNLGDIEMWYGDRYQVQVGDSTRIAYKVKCLVQAINQLESYQSGILDVSFTVWPDEVGYTPFE